MSMEFLPLYEKYTSDSEAVVDVVTKNNRLYKKYYYSMKIPNQSHVDLVIDHLTIDQNCVMKSCTSDYTEFESPSNPNLRYYVWTNMLVVEKILYEELATINYSQYNKKLNIDYLNF